MSKIFVAGATGVLGKRAVKLLVEAGHDVTGVARSAEKAALVASLGATPATIDLFDPVAVKDAVSGHDVVMNLATHIPPASRYAMPGSFGENDRIRTEVSRNLVDAAIATGGDAIRPGIDLLHLPRRRGGVDRRGHGPGHPRVHEEHARRRGQPRRFTDSGGTGVVLRFAAFCTDPTATQLL